MFRSVILTLLTYVYAVSAITFVDNSLMNSPDVRCGPDTIKVSAKTESPFEGVVYINGWRRSDNCFKMAENGTEFATNPSLSVPINDLGRCGLTIKRKPETGEVVIRGVFFFSFHPVFVTKSDRAYAVHCIFRQKELTVASRFSINDLTTKAVIGRTASMPSLGMKIISGSSPELSAESVRTVKVGDPITVMWYLPQPSDMFGIRVRGCTAENLRGSRVRILEDGCTQDKVAISDVTYSESFNEAYATAHAFKFADNEDMWFKCSVKICIKNQNATVSDEDACQPVKHCNVSSRHRRDLQSSDINDEQSEDGTEHMQRLTILDSYNLNRTYKPANSETREKQVSMYTKPQVTKVARQSPWMICMRKSVFALVSSALLLLYTAAFILATVAAVLYFRRKYGNELFPVVS